MQQNSQSESILTDAVQQLYRWAKRDADYLLPATVTLDFLIDDLLKRLIMFMRGLLWRWRFQSVRGPMFLGRSVRIRSAKRISLGSSVTFHDDVCIDARAIDGVQIGNNFTLREFSTVECTGVMRYPGKSLTIGNNVGISQYCFIGVRGPITIGDDVQIGPRVTIYAENHKYNDRGVLIREQGIDRKGITIEDDCWLGTGSTILDGVKIGKGTVVAAGAVVTRSTEPYSIVAGIPARAIARRGQN